VKWQDNTTDWVARENVSDGAIQHYIANRKPRGRPKKINN